MLKSLTPGKGVRTAVAGYVVMVCIGTMYGLSALQTELSRLLDISQSWSLSPFCGASAGLAVGAWVGAKLVPTKGSRSTAALGAVIWGLGMVCSGTAAVTESFVALTLAISVGGAGVGLAYLAVVTSVGPSLPAYPLVGSAIGPLGFTTGTILSLLIATMTDSQTSSLSELGTALVVTGLLIVVLALSAGLMTPQTSRPRRTLVSSPRKRRTGTMLSWLLFANAIPGMMVIAGAVPIISSLTNTPSHKQAEHLFMALAVALFLGGILAPVASRLFSPQTIFATLLLLRGVLLILLPFISSPEGKLLVIATVLFAHGAGFSILPGVIRKSDGPELFPLTYGNVLVFWGLAGIVGSALLAVSAELSQNFDFAFGAVGTLVLVAACVVALRGSLIEETGHGQ